MSVTSRLTQGQRQTLGFRQIQAINLLRLSNEELTADLTRRAAANPFLRLRLPALPPAATREIEQQGNDGLCSHVLAQLRLVGAARADETLALAFVEALDGNGWLDRPVAAIASGVNRTPEAAETMLAALQQAIEPPGLFARDLADCLRLQALDRGQHGPVMAVVLRHLDLLAQGGAEALARASGLATDQVAQCLALLRRMDPRPGLAFGDSPAPLRAPDVIVSRGAHGWQVALNRATLPVIDLAPAPAATPGMRAIRAEAEWLASIVERRNRTVLAVASAVLNRQGGFLDHGPAALLRLSRVEIAAGLGLHDSTVGRVARDLLVETPQGIITLCSLFSAGPSRVSGATSPPAGPDPAATAIRHRLGQLIAGEDPRAPLADAALAALLDAEGKPVARRTIVKYRHEMGIPPRRLRQRHLHADS